MFRKSTGASLTAWDSDKQTAYLTRRVQRKDGRCVSQREVATGQL